MKRGRGEDSFVDLESAASGESGLVVRARFFIAGGTLSRDAPSYVRRAADDQLLAALLDHQYAYLLDSRQKGKSSLVARVIEELESRGYVCVRIDLQRVGANLSADQWYAAILRAFGKRLGIEKEVFEVWSDESRLGPLARWLAVLERAVLPSTDKPIVAFVDEVDFVRALPFSTDEFFAGIRECHNRRAEAPEFGRLTFCLVGSATPSQLVNNIQITPFNIGREIVLTDFTLEEVRPFASGFEFPKDGRALVERVHYWTGGHPYLTQAICLEIAQDPSANEARDVDAIVARMFLTTEARQRQPNLLDISRRILEAHVEGVTPEEARVQMLSAYLQVLRGRRLLVDDSEWRLATLRLCGAVAEERGTLVPRNRIYRRVFDEKWVRANQPDEERRRQRAAARRAMFWTGLVSAAVLGTIGYLWFRADRLAAEQNRLRQAARYDAYASGMIVATTQWDDHDTSGVFQTLQAHKDDPWKNWEWYFWMSRLMGRPVPNLGSTPPGWHFDYSGKRLLARMDGEVRIFSSDDLRLLGSVKMAPGPFWTTQELPNGDFLDLSRDGEVRRFDPKTGAERWRVALGRFLWPNGNLVSSDGRYLVSETPDGLKIVDLENGTPKDVPGRLRRPTFTYGPVPILYAITVDGKGVMDGVARIDARTGEVATWKAGPAVRVVEGCPERGLLVYGTEDSTLVVMDVSSWREIGRYKFRSTIVWGLAFDPSGRWLLASTQDREGAVFSVDNGGLRRVRQLDGYWGFNFSLDGKRILARFHPPTVLDVDAVARPDFGFKFVHINSVYFEREANVIYGAVETAGAIEWVRMDLSEAEPRPHRVALLEGDVLPTGSMHSNLVALHRGVPRGPGAGILPPNLVGLYDPKTWEPYRPSYLGRTREAEVVFRGVGGKDLGFAFTPPCLRRLDPVRGTVEGIDDRSTRSLDVSPDGKTLAVGNEQGILRFFDLATGEDRSVPVTRFTINEGDYSKDGKRLLLCYDPNVAAILDIESGKIVREFRGHAAIVLSVCWSEDEKRVATASADKTVRIWDAETGRLLSILRGHTDQVFLVRFLPGGVHLVSVDSGGHLLRWSAYRDEQSKTR